MKNNNGRMETISDRRLYNQMQDANTFLPDFIHKGWIFGGVYDGHGSDKPAVVASEQIPAVFKGLIKSGLSVIKAFAKAYQVVSDGMIWADGCGTCAANFLIQKGIIQHANVGDCGLVVVGEKLTELTSLHRLDTDSERERIMKAGGIAGGSKVLCNRPFYDGLEPTRTLGDQPFKEVGVTHEPDVGSYQIKSTDKFLVAATDGLFDEMDLLEIQAIGAKKKSAAAFAHALHQEIISRGGPDNLTIIVLKL